MEHAAERVESPVTDQVLLLALQVNVGAAGVGWAAQMMAAAKRKVLKLNAMDMAIENRNQARCSVAPDAMRDLRPELTIG